MKRTNYQLQRKERKRGFTLIEVLVSMVVIVVGLLGFLLANTHIQQKDERVYERMVATQDAHRAIELMRNASATGNFPVNVTSAFPAGTAVPGFNNLIGEQVTVAYADSTADPLDITVTTIWMENGSRSASTELRTLMTQRR